MGLKGDVEEVVRSWKGYPWRLRIWLLLSLILASSSIASLSEAIFKWKLFFLDAITFYRSTLAIPLQSLIEQMVRVRLPQGYAECLLLFLLLFGANLRLALHGTHKSRTRDIAVGSCLGLPVVFFLAPILDGTTPTLKSTVLVLSAIASFQTWIYSKLSGATLILWLVYLLGPLALVGLAGAVNAGLQRAA